MNKTVVWVKAAAAGTNVDNRAEVERVDNVTCIHVSMCGDGEKRVIAAHDICGVELKDDKTGVDLDLKFKLASVNTSYFTAPGHKRKYSGSVTPRMLMVLLELDDGCYHAAQHGRSPRNAAVAEAFSYCEDMELIKTVGDEFFLTEDGKDVLAKANYAVNKDQ